MPMTMERRPDGSSMEGLIWNANYMLDASLDPGGQGIPKNMFKKAHGIVLISSVEFGLVISGNVGAGIIMVKDKDDGKWSPPSAVSFGGIGVGVLFGFADKDLMIFITSEKTLATYTAGSVCKLGAQGNLTFGEGRDGNVAMDVSGKGVGGTVSVAFSEGSFMSASIEGAKISPKEKVNRYYYGKAATPQEILVECGSVEIPKESLIPDLHKKLDLLAEGQTYLPSLEEKERVDLAKYEAFKAQEKNKTRDD